MSLKARQKAHQRQETAATEVPMPGRATWAPPFQTPIHGEVDGDAVRISMLGDQPGSSPVYLCVDGDGNSAIVPLTDVTITDGAYLPLRRSKSTK